jgi:hypothetical protein
MSGLNDVVAAGVETAFAAAKDFVVLGTYYARGSAPVYNPSTDEIEFTPLTYTDVRMLRTSATREEREASSITVGDVKFIIPAVDLEGRVPDETDEIEYGGIRYGILAIKSVPGDTLYIIMARKK